MNYIDKGDNMIFEKGRVCIVRRGRDFGRVVMISETPKKKEFEVLVEGTKVKKSKKNISHLWPVNKEVTNAKDLDKVKL